MFMAAVISSCSEKPYNLEGGNLKPADISSESIECGWIEETAWACSNPFNLKGNWALYTEYWVNLNYAIDKYDRFYVKTQLSAGKNHMDAGRVYYYSPEEINGVETVKVEIKLNEGWRFQEVPENVKAQDYISAPSGNVAPGKFAYKFDAPNTDDNIYTFWLPVNNYYAVHVDVERYVECQ